MKISEKLQGWELEKALYLIKVANQINMEFSEHTVVDVNNTSGYVYLWEENYNFSLFMPINCELQKSDVYALYTDPMNGEEFDISILDVTDATEIQLWADDLYANQ